MTNYLKINGPIIITQLVRVKQGQVFDKKTKDDFYKKACKEIAKCLIAEGHVHVDARLSPNSDDILIRFWLAAYKKERDLP